MTTVENLLNSSSKNMNVDGSSVNKAFSFSPGSGVAQITAITCVFKDEGATDLTKFGAITALTNGVLIQTTLSSGNIQIAVIKDNADLITSFSKNHFGSPALLSILGIVTPEGFGNSNNIFVGRLEFPSPLLLKDSESLSVVIRDNLTAINLLSMTCEIGKDQ